MILYFNPVKFPYLIHSVANSDMPSQICQSLPKFPSSAHSDMQSRLYSSLPKYYPSIQVNLSLDSFIVSFRYSKSNLSINVIIAYKMASNPSKGSYFIPSADHSDISCQLYSSMPKFLSEVYSYISSQTHSLLAKLVHHCLI